MEEGFQSPRHRHVDTGVEFTQPTETTDEDMSVSINYTRYAIDQL
jgi:hypothetical protein